jgi:hypothetical protein
MLKKNTPCNEKVDIYTQEMIMMFNEVESDAGVKQYQMSLDHCSWFICGLLLVCLMRLVQIRSDHYSLLVCSLFYDTITVKFISAG